MKDVIEELEEYSMVYGENVVHNKLITYLYVYSLGTALYETLEYYKNYEAQ